MTAVIFPSVKCGSSCFKPFFFISVELVISLNCCIIVWSFFMYYKPFMWKYVFLTQKKHTKKTGKKMIKKNRQVEMFLVKMYKSRNVYYWAAFKCKKIKRMPLLILYSSSPLSVETSPCSVLCTFVFSPFFTFCLCSDKHRTIPPDMGLRHECMAFLGPYKEPGADALQHFSFSVIFLPSIWIFKCS